MEPGSQAEPAEHSSPKFATAIGTLIALLTLIVPIYTIAQFSASKTEQILQSPAQLLPNNRQE